MWRIYKCVVECENNEDINDQNKITNIAYL